MDKSTRRLIGNVLVWGGVAVIGITHFQLIIGSAPGTAMNHAKIILGSLAGIVVGILWGLRG